jgi:hypothetical protein
VDGIDELAVSNLPQDGIGKGGTDNLKRGGSEHS